MIVDADSSADVHSVDRRTPRRVDLHCHSEASNTAAEVVLNAIRCPECYSDPTRSTRRRPAAGWISSRSPTTTRSTACCASPTAPNVLVGEELTCWFPEDGCKMHVLVYGITPTQHERSRRWRRTSTTSPRTSSDTTSRTRVAHPIYRQNDKLERWHVERLLLMFKGFECLNGAHSSLHRDAFEPLLDQLTQAGDPATQRDARPAAALARAVDQGAHGRERRSRPARTSAGRGRSSRRKRRRSKTC